MVKEVPLKKKFTDKAGRLIIIAHLITSRILKNRSPRALFAKKWESNHTKTYSLHKKWESQHQKWEFRTAYQQLVRAPSVIGELKMVMK